MWQTIIYQTYILNIHCYFDIHSSILRKHQKTLYTKWYVIKAPITGDNYEGKAGSDNDEYGSEN